MTDCKRHPEGNGPYWCQDCHGVHEIETPKPEPYERQKKGGRQLQAIGVHGQERPDNVLAYRRPRG